MDDKKATMAYLSHMLFNELAIHHHNFLLAEKMRNWNLSVPEKERYWEIVDWHNFTMLAITLCKFMEFHKGFRPHLPGPLLRVFDNFNSQLIASGVQDFRNKFAGHIFDNKTGLPLTSTQLNDHVQRLVAGRSNEEFRKWWWHQRGEPQTASIAGSLVALRLHIADSMSEA